MSELEEYAKRNYCVKCGARLGLQNPHTLCDTCRWRKTNP